MPLAGYAWSQIRTRSELALVYGSDSVWKSYSKQKHEKRKSQVLTKLWLNILPSSALYDPTNHPPDLVCAAAGNRRISDNIRCIQNFLGVRNVLCQLVVRKFVGLCRNDYVRSVIVN